MDREDLIKIYDEHYLQLYLLCRVLGIADAEAIIIVSDVFIELYKKVNKGELLGDSNIQSFLFTTVREMSLQQIKQEAWQLIHPV